MAPAPPFPDSHVAVMKEHSKEVFVLGWNPKYDLLVTGYVTKRHTWSRRCCCPFRTDRLTIAFPGCLYQHNNSSGDFTARIWKLPGQTVIMADEDGRPIYDPPAVLKHSQKVRWQTLYVSV